MRWRNYLTETLANFPAKLPILEQQKIYTCYIQIYPFVFFFYSQTIKAKHLIAFRLTLLKLHFLFKL